MKKVLFFISLMGLSSLADVYGVRGWCFINRNYKAHDCAVVSVKDVSPSGEGKEIISINGRDVDFSEFKCESSLGGGFLCYDLESIITRAFQWADQLYIACVDENASAEVFRCDVVRNIAGFLVKGAKDGAFSWMLAYLLQQNNSNQLDLCYEKVQQRVESIFNAGRIVPPSKKVVKKWVDALYLCLNKDGGGLCDIYKEYFNRRTDVQTLKEAYKKHIGSCRRISILTANRQTDVQTLEEVCKKHIGPCKPISILPANRQTDVQTLKEKYKEFKGQYISLYTLPANRQTDVQALKGKYKEHIGPCKPISILPAKAKKPRNAEGNRTERTTRTKKK